MFEFLTKRNGRRTAGAGHTSKRTQQAPFRPQLEGLEDRLVLSGNPPAGYITLSPTGVLSIQTFQSPNALEVDASVNIVTKVARLGISTYQYQVVEASAAATTSYATPVVADYNLSQVTDIVFYGGALTNHFTNNTSINCQAEATGTWNTFTGGTGTDTCTGSNIFGARNFFYNNPQGHDIDYGGGGSTYNTFDVYHQLAVGHGPFGVTFDYWETLDTVYHFNPGHDFQGNPYDVIDNLYN